MSGAIRVIMVAAVARNGVIGRDGDMPWRLSSDLKRFKQVTMGKPVIMGRKTFASIGKSLPGRANIVVSRSAGEIEGVHVVGSVAAAIDLGRRLAGEAGAAAIAVIGGGEIYRQAMAFADELDITHVEADLDGDTVFPAITAQEWEMVSETPVEAGERDSHDMRFAVYRRKSRL